MKKDVRLKGQLKWYLRWPAIVIVLLVILNAWIFRIDRKAGGLMLIFVLIYIVGAGVLFFYSKSVILRDLMDFAAQYGVVQNTLLRELDIPYAILLDDGKFLWTNNEFIEVLGERPGQGSYLSKYIPELNRSVFPQDVGTKTHLEVTYDRRAYEVEIHKVSVDGFNNTEQLLELPQEEEHFIALYLKDVTELKRYIRENEQQRLVAGLIYIDNYDEVMESVEEVRQSLLAALIDRKVNQYIGGNDGIIRKLEKDKYLIVVKKKDFQKMEENKFAILDEVKEVNIGNGLPVTLSIGLGLSSESYVQGYNYARVAIDLALARGGDQAVIKTCEGIKYYGGKREQTSKNTRVKARVKAEALRGLMETKDQIIVMGHKLADADSFGAAIGIYRAATALDKEVHIVLNEITISIKSLYEAFRQNESYPKNLFISSKEAEEYAKGNTMVVVVDTSKPDLVECRELLNKSRTLVVIDHHRQGSDIIENAILSYIEPYASSACEMVAEVLQYIVDNIKLNVIEANSLYAGIMIDTNNFMNRTGVRTFEAAAFLRRCGADITQIRKLYREDLDAYRAKAEIISGAEAYRKEFAIAVGTTRKIDSPTILGAQAANELLDINGIKASFVLTPYNGKIYVSARAIDEVNVQVMMERLGGGGHINIAGAQFNHTEMDEAIDALKMVIDEMIEEGDI